MDQVRFCESGSAVESLHWVVWVRGLVMGMRMRIMRRQVTG